LAKYKKTSARFYKSKTGHEPVRDWLKALNDKDRKIIGIDIATAEYGWPIGMPICRPLGKGLFEIRSNLSGNRISRVIFTIVDTEIILLHGFIKKTQKTPKPELNLAFIRSKDMK